MTIKYHKAWLVIHSLMTCIHFLASSDSQVESFEVDRSKDRYEMEREATLA